MATFNNERFIGQAIASVLRQTMSNFEFLIIDDASTDKTPIILAEYCEKDSRIHVIRNKDNLGLTKSLNIGLKHTPGQFIARMDGDDISHPERLERQYAYMIDNPRCYFLATEGVLIGECGKKIKDIRINFNSHSQKEYILNYGSPFVHSSMMFSRQKVLELGGYDENYKTRQDLELWLKVIYTGLEICVLKERLIYFRYFPQSLSHKSTENLYINVIIKALYRAKDLGININSAEIKKALKQKPEINCYVRRITARRKLKLITNYFISGEITKGATLLFKTIPSLRFAWKKQIEQITFLDSLLKDIIKSRRELNDRRSQNLNIDLIH